MLKDPHPGNILILRDGKIGLIDYGQCYKLKEDDRLALSSIISELGADKINDEMVSQAMRNMGFKFKYHNDNIVTQMAKLLFDSDSARITLGLPSPQELLNYLNAKDPMQHVPDAAGKLPLIRSESVFILNISNIMFLFTPSLCLQNKLSLSWHGIYGRNEYKYCTTLAAPCLNCIGGKEPPLIIFEQIHNNYRFSSPFRK